MAVQSGVYDIALLPIEHVGNDRSTLLKEDLGPTHDPCVGKVGILGE